MNSLSKAAKMSISSLASTYGIKNVNLLRTQGFIDGKWVGDSTSTFDVTNPATDDLLLKVSNLTIEDAHKAIKSSSEAFKSFKTTTARYRADILNKMYHLLMDNVDDLAIICSLENGKPVADSAGEVKYAASFYQWFGEEAQRLTGDVIPSNIPSNRIITVKQPVGVVGILTPWNFPLAMISRKVGAAIATGCTAVVKPASETPLSALAMAYLAHEAGLPKGVFNILPVDHSTTKSIGELFCEDDTIKKVSFTGSTGVGSVLMTQSAKTLKKLSFELGGNAPFIVFEDADIDKAVEGALISKLRQSGQTCVCANRLYVHESVYDEFTKKLVAKVKKCKLGNGLAEGTTHGPLVHSRAVDKVQQHVKDCLDKGATLLLGGKVRTDLGPNFHDLTVIGDVTQEMAVAHEETFGPLVPLIKFSSEEQVLEWANDTEFGLAGYFFTNNYSRIFRLGEQIECGMVGINTGAISEAAVPFGGIKHSGFGREGSKYGVNDYINIKTMVIGGL
ncbi:BA75_01845T0 [Komagataella pastoris]|uniref:Succinate-semialdehyde dehydrogenase n=1 Tax=Komagataella pastoris TaxID=4922 RepID=A0A1B2JA39_PICPA|nr:BA75_01845T0 [Komagataella pastoris]